MEQDNTKVVEVSVYAGKILLENGGEVFRVHDTILRILDAYGFVKKDVYVLSNGIFISAKDINGKSYHAVRQVISRKVNLSKIMEVNELSRDIVSGKSKDADCLLNKLKQISGKAAQPKWQLILACACGCAGFCYIMGGNVWDSCAAFIAGTMLEIFLILSERKKINKFVNIILGSGWVTLCCQLIFTAGVGSSLDSIIIGSIVPLVPGVMLTNAFRDYFNEDYLSGSIHLIEALLMGFCIAVGVGFMLNIWKMVPGVVI